MSQAEEPSRDRRGAVSPAHPTRKFPLAYLITFTCYGTRLHGDEIGSIDRFHNLPGSDFLIPDPIRLSVEQRRMKQPVYEMDAQRRSIVLRAIQGAHGHKGWKLVAVHVRRTHVHAVIAADETPEKLLNNFKSFASRDLNSSRLDGKSRQRWTRHGSTRYLWSLKSVRAAIEYVVRGQGIPMAVWENTEALW